jgi:transcriptional regulator with XRE-family HTH domain
MDDPLEQPEMARRIRAAMSYGKVNIKRAARAVGVSAGHWPRYTSGKTAYTLDIRQLRALAAASGIDPNFFTADLSRLHEIVPPGGYVFKPLEAPEPPAPPSALRQLPEDPRPTDEAGDHEGPESAAGGP